MTENPSDLCVCGLMKPRHNPEYWDVCAICSIRRFHHIMLGHRWCPRFRRAEARLRTGGEEQAPMTRTPHARLLREACRLLDYFVPGRNPDHRGSKDCHCFDCDYRRFAKDARKALAQRRRRDPRDCTCRMDADEPARSCPLHRGA